MSFFREVPASTKVGHAGTLRRVDMDRLFTQRAEEIRARLGFSQPFNHPRILEHHIDGDPILTTWQYVYQPAEAAHIGPLLIGVVSRRENDKLLTLVDRSNNDPRITEHVFPLDPYIERVEKHLEERRQAEKSRR